MLRKEVPAAGCVRAAVCVVCYALAALAVVPGARGQNGSTGNAAIVPVQTIYLARGGCQPAVARLNVPEFMLLVANLSPKADVELVLHSADGTAQATQQFSLTQRTWFQNLKLAPGKYTLDGVNSGHHCKIEIEQ